MKNPNSAAAIAFLLIIWVSVLGLIAYRSAVQFQAPIMKIKTMQEILNGNN